MWTDDDITSGNSATENREKQSYYRVPCWIVPVVCIKCTVSIPIEENWSCHEEWMPDAKSDCFKKKWWIIFLPGPPLYEYCLVQFGKVPPWEGENTSWTAGFGVTTFLVPPVWGKRAYCRMWKFTNHTQFHLYNVKEIARQTRYTAVRCTLAHLSSSDGDVRTAVVAVRKRLGSVYSTRSVSQWEISLGTHNFPQARLPLRSTGMMYPQKCFRQHRAT
jgi:hypothetical protein